MKRFSIATIALALLLCSAFAGPVSHFGALKRCGKNICGEKTGTSAPIFFKGPSLFWSSGNGSSFYKAEIVDWFVDNMQIGIIRAAMGIRYYKENSEPLDAAGTIKGYYFDKASQKNLIKTVVDAAIANDIYVIVDWHSHNAHSETDLAKTFFVEMANEYKNVPNIIWEVYNEPVSADVGSVTNHANTIVSALRSAGNNNLVLIGSPSYSKQPQQQASNWGSRDNNVAFTFHFYAASHAYPSGDNIGTSANGAMSAGNAVFSSEWGAVNYDGNGNVNTSASDSWTTWMDQNKISNCMWNASSLDEGSSMFTPGTGVTNISTSRLRASGTYFQTYMGKNKWTAQIPANHPKGNDVNASVNDGSSITLNSQLGLTGTISEVSTPEFGKATIAADGKSITYETPSSGSPNAEVRFIYKITQNSITVQSKIVLTITNRRPVLPEKAPIAVSRKAPTDINIVSTLSAQDPTGQGLEFESVSVTPPTIGTVVITSNKSIATFTPAASQHNVELAEATLNYTVKSKGGGSNSSSVVLKLQNFAPTIRAQGGTFAPTVPNTDPVEIGMAQNRFSGKDPDGDAIWFDKIYLDPQYPGRLEKVTDSSYLYYPEAGKIGKVTFLAVITDGSANSPTGGLSITLTGSGTDIGNITPPTSIPGVIEPPPEPPEPPVLAYQYNTAKSIGLSSLGFGKIELYFAQNGNAKLDVYSLSGKKIGNLLNGHQNAGSKEVSLKGLNLQRGIYILRLKQGSQIKILRVVN